MDDRDECRERVRETRDSGTTIYIYIYIYILVVEKSGNDFKKSKLQIYESNFFKMSEKYAEK